MGCLEGCFAFSARKRDEGNSKSRAPDLRILTVNDVYKPERFALVRSLASDFQWPRCKLVLPGDVLGGSLFASEHRGESTVEVLNATGVDYCCLGNHEFDYGGERLRELMSLSRFPWLGSNVREASSGELFHSTVDTDSFEVPLEGGAVRVGLFGLCTAATPQLSHPGQGIRFEDPIRQAHRCIKLLQAEGCEVILALTHLSLHQDKELAQACPALTAILGGHDHDPFFLVHHGVLIAKCGQNADHLGVLDFHFHRSPSDSLSGLSVAHSFQLQTTSQVAPDPTVLRAIDKWKVNGDQDVLCTASALSSRTAELRSRESGFGCLVADAMLWAVRQKETLSVQGAIINGGFIRQDREYPPFTGLTVQEVKEEMPFPKHPAVVRLTGRQLLVALEESLRSAPTPVGCFPQLSEGMKLRYNFRAPPLQRIRRLEIDGAEVDPDREYLIVINSLFHEICADGIQTFHSSPCVYHHDELIRDVVVKYLRWRRHVTGECPHRLTAEE
ncbi:unnamed protein product [Effrenium voratum]|nr:unnamed protein product [Effrenium voratum]